MWTWESYVFLSSTCAWAQWSTSLDFAATLQYFCFSTGVLAPGSCGPHVARCARCGSQGEWRAPVWKPSQLCGRSSVLLCGNYPTYVASQQFVPYCPSYSFLPPRSMCALPQFVLIPCFPSGGETIQTMTCLNILLLFCLNIWLTTDKFVILPSDFHTHMISHHITVPENLRANISLILNCF